MRAYQTLYEDIHYVFRIHQDDGQLIKRTHKTFTMYLRKALTGIMYVDS